MKRSAFTLVELLVVIAVITLLVAFLLVAINGARETARRNQCLTQQRDLALALITYDTENNGLPGSLNQFGQTPIHSWAVSIFPMIGENKRYEFLTKDTPVPNEVTQATVSLPALLCPSDNLQGNARLNYFVNCGPINYLPNGNSNIDFVLFRDRRSDLISVNPKVKIDEIPDGASNTILLLEDTKEDSTVSSTWYDPNWLNYAPNEYPVNSAPTRSTLVVEHLGFTWGEAKAKLSSKHVGTGNAAYADGSAISVNSDISVWELIKALCPDDEQARKLIGDGGLGLTGL